jgi:hypothetical protein
MSQAPNEQGHVPARFFGKYRGRVIDNVDPQSLGRIQAEVPSVAGSATSWAMPCVPYADTYTGSFSPPPVGTNVWIEFEAGDANTPIWSGVFFAPGDLSTE